MHKINKCKIYNTALAQTFSRWHRAILIELFYESIDTVLNSLHYEMLPLS